MTKPIEYPEPPGHLSERLRALWCELVPARCKSAGRIALLQEALEALDRADQARAVVQAEGLTITSKTTGVVHLNPCVKIELEARRQFSTIWDRLSLGWDAHVDGRNAG